MKLQFNLEYKTAFGENLKLNIIAPTQRQRFDMMTTDGLHWQAEPMLKVQKGEQIDYYYSVEEGGHDKRTEWLQEPHRLDLAATEGNSYIIRDQWIDMPSDSYMYSSAITDCIAVREKQPIATTDYSRTIRLKVRAPQLRKNQRLALIGSDPCLGSWQPADALPMQEHNHHEWAISLDAAKVGCRFEFKFVAIDQTAQQQPLWENGLNRVVDIQPLRDKEVLVIELRQANFPAYPWRGAGTVIPVFSLRSEGSFGVGDFGDLKMMVDWCAKTGQSCLQLLPINDTTFTHTWQDSYPYNAVSIYALHPQYCDIRQLPKLKDKALRQEMEAIRQELNALPEIDYERVNNAKRHYLHIIFKQEWEKTAKTRDYKQFFEHNREWLEPYARFSAEAATDREQAEEEFYFFVQYHLDRQMRQAHNHARENHIILKGDIPIGISRDGVEAKVEPKYFNLDGQAGAPPDAFAEDGQNWGFPTYNWDVMLQDGCKWWVRRFSKMQEYFDAYRIDHVLGFFRIWEIPMPQKSGLYGQFQPSLPLSRDEIAAAGLPFCQDLYLEDHKKKDMWHPRINAPKTEAFRNLPYHEQQRFWDLYNDYFYKRNNQFWYDEAMKKLPRLTQATRMLCCAEDLGMVPECVPWVMDDLRILTLEIQSMPKDPKVRFGVLERNPYRSVCTISTHDMATLRQWWDEDYERTQDYFNNMMHRGGPAPHPLPGWLAREIVARHLASPSMLCLLSLQDWLSIDDSLRLTNADAERINIPANPRHYWRYRMHLTIEELLAAQKFNDDIHDLIRNNQRE